MTRAIHIDPPRPQWYVAVFDVAGGVREWLGPYRHRRARRVALAQERLEYVLRARVQQHNPVLASLTAF